MSGFIDTLMNAPPAGTAPRAAGAISVEVDLSFEGALADVPEAAEVDGALAPGASAPIAVAVTRVQHGSARAIKVSKELVLTIAWNGPPGVTVAPARIKVLRSALDVHGDDVVEVMVTASAGAPRMVGEIAVRAGSQLLATKRLLVGGTYAAPEPEVLELCQVKLDAAPPEDVSLLHVGDAGAGMLSLFGYGPVSATLHVKIARPNVNLADLTERKTSFRTILTTLRSFSQNLDPAVLRWLRDSLPDGDDRALVVCDHTESETPWEMVEIADAKPIGALGRVVRWGPFQLFDQRVWFPLGDVRRAGRALAHVDPGALAGSQAELVELDRTSSETCATPDELRQRLGAAPADLGQVFFACHGVFLAHGSEAQRMAALENPHGRTSDLDLYAISALAQPRPVVFVNACHSARVLRGPNGLAGLPPPFLTRVGAALLGTIGPVDAAFASALAAEILREARGPGGVDLPRKLTELRRAAAAQLDLDRAPSRQRYLHTFLYVLYGGPRVTLALSPRAPG